MSLNRRRLLQGVAGLAGACVLPSRALAAPMAEKTTVVVINCLGGLHSMFAQADSFVPRGLFSCSPSNTTDLGSGVVVDTETIGSMPSEALAHMCNLGVWHGISAHDLAQSSLVLDPRGQSYPLQLAHAMGGEAPVACADLGRVPGKHKPFGSTSLSKLTDAGAVLTALGVSPVDEYVPARGPALAGLKASIRMSKPTLARNQRSLESVTNGLSSLVRALSSPPAAIDWPTISAAYGLRATDTLISSMPSQFATAELLVHAGTNVVMLSGEGAVCGLGFDSHGDKAGECIREGMKQSIFPSLRTFLSRTMAIPGHNVVTVLVGDFTRSFDSDHASMLVATAFGKHLKLGTSGAFTIDQANYNSYVPKNGQTPRIPQLWSFLAAAAGAAENPFGENPHPFISAS